MSICNSTSLTFLVEENKKVSGTKLWSSSATQFRLQERLVFTAVQILLYNRFEQPDRLLYRTWTTSPHSQISVAPPLLQWKLPPASI